MHQQSSKRTSLQTWSAWAATLVALALAVGACSGQRLNDPDGDGTRETARPFLKGGPTEDKLSRRIGDNSDWRFIQPSRAGTMKMRVSVGKWQESTIRGYVTVFSEVGDRIVEKLMPVGSGTLVFKFDVKDDMRYLVRFRCDTGEGQYAVEVDFDGNPCDACNDTQICQDDKCVPKPPEKKPRPRKSPRRRVSKPSKPKKSAISCRVIDARVSGSGSLLTLTAGDNKGVKKGMKGSVKGRRGSSFTIIAVYPTRSKARCKLGAEKFRPNDTAVLR